MAETPPRDSGTGQTWRRPEGQLRGVLRARLCWIIGESNKDKRLPTKELVIGLNLGGDGLAAPFRTNVDQPVINDYFAGKDLLVTFDPASETGAVFNRRVDGRTPIFRPLTQSDLIGEAMLMRDDKTGTVWQALTGRALEGPFQGTVLTREPSHYSFWLAWSDFHPDTELYWDAAG